MNRLQYQRELDRLEPGVRKAFLEWARDRARLVRVKDVERLIESQEFGLLLETMGVTEASLANVTEAIRTVYVTAGRLEAPAVQVVFDMRNRLAEDWVRQNSSQFVTRVIESQREAIREVVESGLQAGNNPRRTALDIVGRVSKRTGRREGGVVGLSGPQARYVVSARMELFRGDPESLRSYLMRERRDRSFDGLIIRSIRDETRLSVDQIDRIAGRYSDRLLLLRGETIARTETISALNAARDQAWEQAIQEGKISASSITNRWSATMGPRTRDSHKALNGQTRPHGEPFQSTTGALMMRPGDTSLGAGPEDVINCRCFLEKRADFIGEALRRQPNRRVAGGG